MFTLYHTQQQQQQQQQQQFVRHKKYYYLITNSNCRFGGREISEMFFFRLGRFKNLSTQTNNWTMTDSSLTPDILLIFTAPIFERFEDWDEVERARKEEREREWKRWWALSSHHARTKKNHTAVEMSTLRVVKTSFRTRRSLGRSVVRSGDGSEDERARDVGSAHLENRKHFIAGRERRSGWHY